MKKQNLSVASDQWSVVSGNQTPPSAFRLPPSAGRSSLIFQRSSSARAFTLVELLVVIAIIGMLMALLLPAVQSAKETARRATCLNNMKQLSIAVLSFESSKGEVPGYANELNKTGTTRLTSWIVMLFPYMGQPNVWATWNDSAQKPQAPYMELLNCASNPPQDQAGPWISYVANCGRQDPTTAGTSPPVPLSDAKYSLTEKPGNGVFFDQYKYLHIGNAAMQARHMRLTTTLDKIPDGASNTLMLSENTAAYKYADPQGEFGNNSQNLECAAGFVWNPKDTGAPRPTIDRAEQINAVDAGDTKDLRIHSTAAIDFGTPKAYWYARPSSFHPGGVNVAMCGGELFFLRDDIDYRVYKQLMTTDGKPLHSDDTDNQLLQDADYK